MKIIIDVSTFSENLRISIAEETTDTLALSELAKDECDYVRIAVALNSQTSAETLVYLANDEEQAVKTAVAENPHTPIETLVKLTEENNYWGVKKAIAENSQTPIEILDILSEHEHHLVRESVAKNIHTSTKTLLKLATDEDCYGVMATAKTNLANRKNVKSVKNEKETDGESCLVKNIISEVLNKSQPYTGDNINSRD